MQNPAHLSLPFFDAPPAITGGSTSFERDGDLHPWTIRNRYYEADVGFKIVDSPEHLLDCLRAENGAAAAVILVVDKSKVNIEGASASYSFGDQLTDRDGAMLCVPTIASLPVPATLTTSLPCRPSIWTSSTSSIPIL